MSQPLISIITPSYNQGIYIEKTIQSVLRQTYKNYEYIIVDAKSTDETVDILEKYKDVENIKIIVEKDRGQSDAINKGFKIAKGELVGWINSDDLLKEDCLEKIVDGYEKNKDASIFYGDVDFIDEDGSFIRTVQSNKITYDYLLNVNADVVQPGSFYKTQYVKEVGYLDDKIHYTMDYDLWLRLLKKGKAVRVDGVLSDFRLQLNSKTMTSGNGIKFWKDIFSVRKTKHKGKILSRLHLNFLKWAIKGAIRRVTK